MKSNTHVYIDHTELCDHACTVSKGTHGRISAARGRCTSFGARPLAAEAVRGSHPLVFPPLSARQRTLSYWRSEETTTNNKLIILVLCFGRVFLRGPRQGIASHRGSNATVHNDSEMNERTKFANFFPVAKRRKQAEHVTTILPQDVTPTTGQGAARYTQGYMEIGTGPCCWPSTKSI